MKKETPEDDTVLEKIEDKVKDRVQEYRQFAFKDDMLKLAIAFILGGAFTKTVTAISECLIMPLLNFITQHGGSWREAVWEPIEGLIFEIGAFGAASVDFILISVVLFFMWKTASVIREEKPIRTVWKKIFPWKIVRRD